MSMVKTAAGEIGIAVAEAIRDAMTKATAGATIGTYIEGQPPVAWGVLGDAGWDLAGVIEDEDSTSLRDLVEIAGAWGETLVQLPLVTSLAVKRHSVAAAEAEGPVTLSVPVHTLPSGTGFVPFGQVPGISIIDSFADGSPVRAFEGGSPLDFAPSLLAASSPGTTNLSAEARRELAVIWAAEAAGRASQVLQEAIEFTKQRQQFGKPIGSFQAVKHHLANAHIAAEFAQTAAIWASLDEASTRKAVTQSFAQSLKSVQLSIQTYGGLGFTWEMGLHFSLRHITTLRELAAGVLNDA